MQSLILKAKELATVAHEGQLYGDNLPYIGHVARVASFFGNQVSLSCVAWLHDVVEDTPITILRVDWGFGGYISDGVAAITRREETYNEYLTRVENNPLAKRVKIIDLADNLSNCFNSKGRVKEEHKVKQKRYVKALRRLLK